jgi:uncharacterized protein (DUF3084 family)
MLRIKHAFEFPLLLTCLLALASCSGSAILQTTQSERDQLVEDLAQIAGERDKAESGLAAVTTSFQRLQSQVPQLTAQRDQALAQARTAQATVESLTTQLREKERGHSTSS